MNPTCFTIHNNYLNKLPSGIVVCMACAARREVALEAQAAQTKAKVLERQVAGNSPLTILNTGGSIDQMSPIKCMRCSHKWMPRVVHPSKCPKCTSPYWDKPYKIKKRKAKPPKS